MVFTHTIHSDKSGVIKNINNRKLAKIAKLAGAPQSKSAGVDLHVRLTDKISNDDPFFTVHLETQVNLNMSYHFFKKDKILYHAVKILNESHYFFIVSSFQIIRQSDRKF
ncbi:MAG: hypothetical protein H0U71_01645 [Gammaproteobacteria bacterium]|nr:hypothetical protein [Gammaproteobacteria bacterium]